MKNSQRIFLTLFLFLALVIVFRNWFYNNLIAYKSIGTRKNYSVTDKKLIEYIHAKLDVKREPEIKQIIKLSLSITSSTLNFTAKNNDKDPNKLINSKTAHCEGYAFFFASTCNYMLEKYKLSGSWTAQPHIGQLYFLGHNIHKNFESAFFKTHDFVTITNKKTGTIYAVDPTVHDYLFIDFIRHIK